MNTDRHLIAAIAILSAALVAAIALAIIFIPADATACPGGADPVSYVTMPVGDVDVDLPICE